MENGDYIKIRGHLCKIVDINNTPPIVFDYNVQKETTNELVGCNIVINKDVLCNCCGFHKTDSQYIVTDIHNNSSHFVIRYETTPIKGRCYIDITGQMHTIISEHRIIVLSVLQDFVRNHTGCELNINTERLLSLFQR